MLDRWRRLPWIRRFWLVCAAFALAACLFYGVENLRGNLRMAGAMERASASGFPMSFEERMSPASPDTGENFADCLRVIDRIDDAGNLAPGFRGLRPHEEFFHRATYPGGWRFALPEELTLSVSPQANSEIEAATRILALVDQWSSELAEIEAASRAKECDYGIDWSINVQDIRFIYLSPIYEALGLRAYCHVIVGDAGSAVDDLETMGRVAKLTGRRPLWFHAYGQGRFSQQFCEVVWLGLDRGAFAAEDIDRLITTLEETEYRDFALRALVNEEAFAVRFAEQNYLSQSSRMQRTSSYPPDYWPDDPVGGTALDTELLAYAERWTYVALPSGWFKLSQADKLDHFLDVVTRSPSMLDLYRYADQLDARETPYYGVVWKGAEFTDGYREVVASMLEIAAELELARAALGLERYRVRRGSYPDSWEFMEEPPIDPWSELPLKFLSVAGGRPVIYSIGRDRVDDGGLPSDRGTPGDLVWRYQSPTPRVSPAQ